MKRDGIMLNFQFSHITWISLKDRKFDILIKCNAFRTKLFTFLLKVTLQEEINTFSPLNAILNKK